MSDDGYKIGIDYDFYKESVYKKESLNSLSEHHPDSITATDGYRLFEIYTGKYAGIVFGVKNLEVIDVEDQADDIVTFEYDSIIPHNPYPGIDTGPIIEEYLKHFVLDALEKEVNRMKSFTEQMVDEGLDLEGLEYNDGTLIIRKTEDGDTLVSYCPYIPLLNK